MPETKQTITREAAFASNKRRYYTGTACKRGHYAERYVSTGGCVECLRPFQAKRNAFDHRATPYTPLALWARRDYTEAERVELSKYLQTCIDTFDRAKRPDELPLMYDAPKVQAVTPTSAPKVAGELPSFEALPSADRKAGRPARCSHGNDGEFCTLCEAEENDE